MSIEDLNEYRLFLEAIKNNKEKLEENLFSRNASYQLNDTEVLGELISNAINFLTDFDCPTKFIVPVVRNVIQYYQSNEKELFSSCCSDSQSESCCPLKLKRTVLKIIEDCCQSLLDNVELNKILNNEDNLSTSVFGAVKNRRRLMEDRHICIDDFDGLYNIENCSKASFYGVFDGHDGLSASSYAVSQLPYALASQSNVSSDPVEALRKAFLQTDSNFVKKDIKGGTTVVCALYLPHIQRLCIAWVGDSKALLVKQGHLMQIVKPHKPDDPEEKKRITNAGGSVIDYDGILRVDGLINLSRAIGDVKCKPYLTAEPDIVVLDLDQNEDFLVLGCDGLWDHVDEEDIAYTIYDSLRQNNNDVKNIPELLIEKAKQCGSSDNITVVVVFLKPPHSIYIDSNQLEIMNSAACDKSLKQSIKTDENEVCKNGFEHPEIEVNTDMQKQSEKEFVDYEYATNEKYSDDVNDEYKKHEIENAFNNCDVSEAFENQNTQHNLELYKEENPDDLTDFANCEVVTTTLTGITPDQFINFANKAANIEESEVEQFTHITESGTTLEENRNKDFGNENLASEISVSRIDENVNFNDSESYQDEKEKIVEESKENLQKDAFEQPPAYFSEPNEEYATQEIINASDFGNEIELDDDEPQQLILNEENNFGSNLETPEPLNENINNEIKQIQGEIILKQNENTNGAEKSDDSDDEWSYMQGEKEGQGEKQETETTEKETKQTFDTDKSHERQDDNSYERQDDYSHEIESRLQFEAEKPFENENTVEEASSEILESQDKSQTHDPLHFDHENLLQNENIIENISEILQSQPIKFVAENESVPDNEMLDNEYVCDKENYATSPPDFAQLTSGYSKLQQRLDDDIVAQSPSKCTFNMESVQIPEEELFDKEADLRPHEVNEEIIIPEKCPIPCGILCGDEKRMGIHEDDSLLANNLMLSNQSDDVEQEEQIFKPTVDEISQQLENLDMNSSIYLKNPNADVSEPETTEELVSPVKESSLEAELPLDIKQMADTQIENNDDVKEYPVDEIQNEQEIESKQFSNIEISHETQTEQVITEISYESPIEQLNKIETPDFEMEKEVITNIEFDKNNQHIPTEDNSFEELKQPDLIEIETPPVSNDILHAEIPKEQKTEIISCIDSEEQKSEIISGVEEITKQQALLPKPSLEVIKKDENLQVVKKDENLQVVKKENLQTVKSKKPLASPRTATTSTATKPKSIGAKPSVSVTKTSNLKTSPSKPLPTAKTPETSKTKTLTDQKPKTTITGRPKTAPVPLTKTGEKKSIGATTSTLKTEPRAQSAIVKSRITTKTVTKTTIPTDPTAPKKTTSVTGVTSVKPKTTTVTTTSSTKVLNAVQPKVIKKTSGITPNVTKQPSLSQTKTDSIPTTTKTTKPAISKVNSSAPKRPTAAPIRKLPPTLPRKVAEDSKSKPIGKTTNLAPKTSTTTVTRKVPSPIKKVQTSNERTKLSNKVDVKDKENIAKTPPPIKAPKSTEIIKSPIDHDVNNVLIAGGDILKPTTNGDIHETSTVIQACLVTNETAANE